MPSIIRTGIPVSGAAKLVSSASKSATWPARPARRSPTNRRSLSRPLLQGMPVFPLHAVAGREGGFALIAFPNFMIERLARRAAQRLFLENVALVVAIQFHKPRLLAWVESVGQYNQNFSFGAHLILFRVRVTLERLKLLRVGLPEENQFRQHPQRLRFQKGCDDLDRRLHLARAQASRLKQLASGLVPHFTGMGAARAL